MAWVLDNERLKKENERLSERNEFLQNRMERMQLADSLKVRSIYENYFDPYDAENFRVYGLFRDAEQNYSVKSIAEKFNIETASAVKSSVVLGEDWYIVPVKGIHFVTKGDTPESIAKRYYFSPKDADLIRAFNKEISPGKKVFIPFD